MTKEFWQKFEQRYPQDYLVLKEVLPFEQLEHMLKMDLEDFESAGKQLHFIHNWLAGYFRDAIEYGYHLGYVDGKTDKNNRYGCAFKFKLVKS